MAESESSMAAVYVSFTTFKNSLVQLSQGVPNRIDKTVFVGMAGGVQSQLMAALKFLGLIDADGKPTQSLIALAVPDEADRKAQLKKLLQERYPDIFSLDITKTTMGELAEKMQESYKVTGSTRDRAVKFFLSAVEYAGVPVSRLLIKAKVSAPANGGGTVPRKRRGRPAGSSRNEQEIPVTPAPAGANGSQGDSRIVTLKSGGTLTVSTSMGMFSLIPSDRKFFNELIEKLEAYEEQNPPDAEE